ncbi:MAG: PAS domain S-box protein [Desulfobacula sp.]|nr:PAS domain S-box protein [Desulfobacula sp.]
MNRLLKIFLQHYDPREKEVCLTARFALIAILCALLTISVTIVYSSWFRGLGSIIVLAQVFAFMIILVALGLLVKGNYRAAVHLLFLTGFSTIWAVMFLGSNRSIVTKLDTIVFIIGLMAALPVAAKSRKPISAYFAFNLCLFLIFNYHLKKTASLGADAHLDYFLDNLVVMTCVFLASFNIFTIRQKALTSLKEELDNRKKTEKELLESRHQLSVHLKNTPVGAISWDTEFRVREWNPSAESIFGYSRDEAMGKHVADLILPEDVREQVNLVFQNLLAGRGGERNMNENITKSGKRILCDWYNTRLKTIDGKIIGVASLVNDITERKKTQEMMIQSEKMMSVGGLAAGMAHEINNPLSGIMQNAQIIHNRLTRDIPANHDTAEELGTSMAVIRGFMEKRGILRQLENIHQAGRQVAEIIENMLSFSKKSDLKRKEINLEDLIDTTLDLVKNDVSFKKKNGFQPIEIIKEYNPDLPGIYGEKSKIQQVLFNLVKNASQSMNSKTYANDTPKLTIRLKKGLTQVHIEVEDNGTGMDPETCKHVFEPFFTTKGPEKGTGLGLSISYFIIVDHHGGQMEVDSTPGKGSLFTVKLPFRSKNRTC